MYIKKSVLTVAICFAVAGALVLGGFILKANSGLGTMQNSAKYTYQESIANLAEGLANIDYALQKTLAADSPQQTVSLSAEVWREAGMAEMCLEALPVYELNLENIMRFFHQSGEYALYLAKKAIGGDQLTEEEEENLRALSEQAKTLATAMTEFEYQIQSENADFDTLTSFLSYVDQPPEADETDENGTAILYEYKNPLMKMESEMQMPTLNYEGNFSSHLVETSYEFLADKETISQEEARRRAAYILDCEPKDLTCGEDVLSKELMLYCFSGKNMDICVTAAEGYPYSFSKSGVVADVTVSDEEALEIAEKYLNKVKFSNMEPVKTNSAGNVLLVEFAYEEGEALCLTDKILVGVALDTGTVCAFDASEYLKNHVVGRNIKPTLSYEEAADKLSDSLSVDDSRLVVIGTKSYDEPERLCYEFTCENDSGNGVVVYINAHNGTEEKIDLIYENDNGSYVLE
ncbi:MAG: germination protein YpeB [Clostridia bacterium]|nr:germination protein YpeB [Clostridia bacterium]